MTDAETIEQLRAELWEAKRSLEAMTSERDECKKTEAYLRERNWATQQERDRLAAELVQVTVVRDAAVEHFMMLKDQIAGLREVAKALEPTA